MKSLLKKLSEVTSEEQSYLEDLQKISELELSPFYYNCKRIVDNKTDISKETSSYLYDFVLPIIECSLSYIVPLQLLTWRMCRQYPEIIYDIIDNEKWENIIITYEDIYDYLKEFTPISAELIIKKITTDNNIINKLIISFRNSNKDHFCDTLYNLEEDISLFTDKLCKVNHLYNTSVHLSNIFKDSEEIEDNSPLLSPNIISGLCRIAGYNGQNINVENIATLQNSFEKFYNLLYYLDDEEKFISKIANDVQGFEEALTSFFIIFTTLYDIYKCLFDKLPVKDYLILKAFHEVQPISVKNSINKILKIMDYGELFREDLISPNQQNTKENNHNEVICTEHFLPDDFFEKGNRSKKEELFVGRIEKKYEEKGITTFCSLINFLASEGYINNTDENKKNFAFKLSGYYDEYNQDKIKWYGETNILSVLIQKICYSSKKWERAKVMFEFEQKLYNSSALRKNKTADKDFANLFMQLYDEDLYH